MEERVPLLTPATSGAFYCEISSACASEPACSRSRQPLLVHHHYRSLSSRLLLCSLVVLLSVTLISASSHSGDLCQDISSGEPVCTAKPLNMAGERERTFIMIKPDGVQRGLVGEIIRRFEQKGFHLVSMKFMWASEDLLKQHYADLAARPFFPGLVKYMSSGPVVPMVTIHILAFIWS